MTTGKTLRGRWRIVEMDLWDTDAVDLLGPALIEFNGRTGSFRFIAVECSMDVRSPVKRTKHDAEFSFEGFDDCDPTSGRGWASVAEDGSLTWKDLLSHGGRLRLPGGTGEAMRGWGRRRSREPEALRSVAPNFASATDTCELIGAYA